MADENTDRNLLFGVLALQLDLITASQLADACSGWAARREAALADILAERGWVGPEDRAEVDRLLDRKLRKHAGDVHATLADAADDRARAVLAGVDDEGVRHSIPDATGPEGHVLLSTIAHQPEGRDRYTLTRLHATGGLGRVWLARDADLGRDVALKELRPERTGSPSVWARFFEEAKITGQLEHPNIVPVHELVRPTGGGQPFYTMRFVKGRTLSEATRAYHRRRREGDPAPMAFRDLLHAFLGVCNAVNYAHARGVIHRDLKGQNVVLGDFGEVVVLDWGLAKLVDRPEETITPAVELGPDAGRGETMAGQALGTPAYMAPEQAEGDWGRVDRRSDVYGLGAILYEILSGEPPFSGDDTAEVLRRVVHEPPQSPRSRHPEAPKALEAVCLKALAKRPGDRYESAAVLADEVKHFLADEPVSAFREPIPARLGRWARRHRPLVAGAAALLVAAVVSLGVGAVLIDRERARAEESFRQARAAVDDYFTTVSESELLDVPTLEPLRKSLLEKALRYYQGFLRQRGDDPSVRGELAATNYRVAWITGMIGSQAEAEAAYRRAVALYEALGRDHPDEMRYRVDLGICLNDLGNVLRALGRAEEALVTHRRALAIREPLARPRPEGARFQNELAKSLGNVGDLLIETGHPTEGLALYEQALAINRAVVAARPAAEDFELPTSLGGRFNNLESVEKDVAINELAIAYCLGQLDRPTEAEAARRRAIARLDRLVREAPLDTELRSLLAGALLALGDMLAREPGADRHDEAQEHLRRARAILEPLARDHPSVTGVRSQLAAASNALAWLLRRLDRPEDALELYEEAATVLRALVRDEAEVVGFRDTLAFTYRGLGRVYADLDRSEEALRSFEAAAAIDEPLAPTYPRSRYNLACDLALCLPLVGSGQGPSAADVEGRRRDLADRAVAAIREAIAAGYGSAEFIDRDPDIDSIRGRDDYRALIAELRERARREGPGATNRGSP